MVFGLVVAVGMMSGCGKAPDQQTESEPTVPAQAVQPPVESLNLPQTNANLSVTLESLPPGLVVTYNDSFWIELVDAERPSIRYALIGNPPGQAGVAPSSPAEFETRIRQSPNGKIVDEGAVKTDLGDAVWVAGRYDDDDGPVVDIHLFVPTRPDRGALVLTSVCPPDVAPVDQRLSVMRDLLAHLS